MDAEASGVKTSEFKFSAAVAAFGGILQGIAIALQSIKDAGFDPTWVSVALIVVGGLLQVTGGLGYVASRTTLKATQLKADAALNATDEAIARVTRFTQAP